MVTVVRRVLSGIGHENLDVRGANAVALLLVAAKVLSMDMNEVEDV